jgi:hypothetical protein
MDRTLERTPRTRKKWPRRKKEKADCHQGQSAFFLGRESV